MSKSGKNGKKFVSIADRAMLVDLDVSAWSGKVVDNEATTKTEDSYEATHGVGRFSKRLMPKTREYKDISKAINHARSLHNKLTLPWAGRDVRIILAAGYMDYRKAMQQASDQFNSAVRVMLHNYPRLKSIQKKRLGKLFNEEDFPTVEALKELFKIEVHVLPIPTANDFRCKLVDSELKHIQKELRDQEQENAKLAMQALWQRFHKMVARLANRLQDEDAIIRDSLVEGIRDFCETQLPSMNLLDDAELENIRKTVLKYAAVSLTG